MDFYDSEVLNFYASMASKGLQPEKMYNNNAMEGAIEMEIQSMKTAYAQDEDTFVEEMMIKHPIVVERRANLFGQERSMESIQRAESCRKSRVNNKIKKTKMRLRHQFASKKMKESASLLDHINDIIAGVETQLIRRGMPASRLNFLRKQFGVDSAAASPSPVLWQAFGYQ